MTSQFRLIFGFMMIISAYALLTISQGCLPPSQECPEIIIKKQKIAAHRCYVCSETKQLIGTHEDILKAPDSNAQNFQRVLTRIFKEPKTLGFETKRIRFRQLTMRDFDTFHRMCKKPAVARTATWAQHRSREESKHIFQEWLRNYKKVYIAPWAIADITTDALLGFGGHTILYPSGRRAFIAFVFDKKHWGKGYETEAARALVEYSFTACHLNRVEAIVRTDNKAHQSAMIEAGMSNEGILREYKWVGNTPLNFYSYAVLRQDIANKLITPESLGYTPPW